MKRKTMTRATGMGMKLLLSLLVLLLALTGCNAPNTPMDTTPEETSEVTPEETTEDLVEDTTAEPETGKTTDWVPPELPGGVPSQELQDAISMAHQNRFGSPWKYYYEAFAVTYYGLYDDCAVLFLPGQYCITQEILIGDYTFIYNYSFSLCVYRDGEIYDLSEAYSSGWITEDQLVTIYMIHTAFNNNGR